MIGRLYINELTEKDVIIDLSAWPSKILDDRNPYGFAFRKTLQYLGVGRHDLDYRSSILSGSTEVVTGNTDTLRSNIGLIARVGAERAAFYRVFVENDITRNLRNITEKFLPIVTSSVEFPEVVELITAPFADATNDGNEAFRIIHGQQPDWTDTSIDYATKRQILIDEYTSNLVGERK